MRTPKQTGHAESREFARSPVRVDSARHSGQAAFATDGSGDAPRVSLLTGGGDKPYALGLASSLTFQGVPIDFIGSDEVDGSELKSPLAHCLNLRGDMRPDAPALRKIFRILSYYYRLVRYAIAAKPRVFHILWNNKLEFVDRVLLLLLYRLLGKHIAFTAHNVNAGRRDGNDSVLNRLTLKVQYQLVDHIFVHTEQMRKELKTEFNVSGQKVSVIPFGINSTVPNTDLTPESARRRLALAGNEKVVLFFGNIAPYKGLEYLLDSFASLARTDADYRLIVAGRPKCSDAYWEVLRQKMSRSELQSNVTQRIEYVPDADTEVYFKAADLLVLPYTHIFQSGVLFLSYNFGLPVIASDVGSLREDIIEGRTGFVCRPRDSADLADRIKEYFSSELYQHLEARRGEIREYANEKYSWTRIGEITRAVYLDLLAQR